MQQVAAHEERGSRSCQFQFGGQRFSIRMGTVEVDGDVRARRVQRTGDGGADPPCPARDQGDLVLHELYSRVFFLILLEALLRADR